MKGFLAAAALAGVAIASPMPQASGGSCSPDRAGEFTITIVNVTRSAKRDLEVRQQLDGTLMLTLEGGILKDQAGRTGYIAANRQFQFDNPIQAGAVVTSGWSSCSNNSLALGGSAVFYQCLSGTFYNLYDQSQGGQCNPIYIVAQSGSASTAAASVLPDGQPQATTAVTQLSDGQPQATSVPAPPVTVLSDGQPQATSVQGPPVTVLSDGQPQATSIQGPPVTVLSDGQPQATTAQGPAVTVLSDGQPQAPTITQISDGQIQAPTSSAPIATFTGAANRNAGGFAFVAGIVGAVALL